MHTVHHPRPSNPCLGCSPWGNALFYPALGHSSSPLNTSVSTKQVFKEDWLHLNNDSSLWFPLLVKIMNIVVSPKLNSHWKSFGMDYKLTQKSHIIHLLNRSIKNIFSILNNVHNGLQAIQNLWLFELFTHFALLFTLIGCQSSWAT